jgi:dihydropteroate synthase
VARAALAAGASIVNDIGANRSETEMWRITADAGAGYVCMHMQGTPRTMQAEPHYQDVVREVRAFFSLQMEQMFRCGLSARQIIVDPGIGFGKTLDHNLELLGGLREFASLGRPLLLGVSRKSFLGKLLGAGLESRLAPALACACMAVEAGANILRVHDVAETVQAIRMTEAILARRRK